MYLKMMVLPSEALFQTLALEKNLPWHVDRCQFNFSINPSCELACIKDHHFTVRCIDGDT